jgi:hypothetical protein
MQQVALLGSGLFPSDHHLAVILSGALIDDDAMVDIHGIQHPRRVMKWLKVWSGGGRLVRATL